MAIIVDQFFCSLFKRVSRSVRRVFSTDKSRHFAAAIDQLPSFKISHTRFGDRAFVSSGSGTHTVVFESGLGDGKEVWAPVFNAVSAETRVVAYDRAGYGQSEHAPNTRDGFQIVQELRALLRTENIPPPYILVGHSLGGAIVKLFARMHQDEVVGVVLVDARSAYFDKNCRQMEWLRLIYEASLGFLMLGRTTMRAELQAAPVTLNQARWAGPFPSVPLMVLTHQRNAFHWPQGVVRAWANSQTSMAGMSALGRIRICEDSGHHVHKDRPDLVARAVIGVLAAARAAVKKSE